MAKKSKREEFDPEKMREAAFKDSKFDPKNQRYGLFSYTGTLAISNKPYFSQSISHRDADGLVKTAPKNFFTSPVKKGKTSDVYFSPPKYSSDNYIETAKPYLKDKQNADGMRKNHQVAWRPGGLKHEPYSLYENLRTEEEKKVFKKGPDGQIVLEPRNFLTSPMKKGNPNCTPGLLISKEPEYVPDAYDRKKELDFADHVKHRSKMQPEQFKGNDPGGRFFSKNEQLFGGDFSNRKEKSVGGSRSADKVAVPFYSLVARTGECFEKYPEYKPDDRVAAKKDPPIDKPSWKSTTQIRTIPSPSITCSARNLRKEFGMLRHS
jgi:hypothetical protein